MSPSVLYPKHKWSYMDQIDKQLHFVQWNSEIWTMSYPKVVRFPKNIIGWWNIISTILGSWPFDRTIQQERLLFCDVGPKMQYEPRYLRQKMDCAGDTFFICAKILPSGLSWCPQIPQIASPKFYLWISKTPDYCSHSSSRFVELERPNSENTCNTGVYWYVCYKYPPRWDALC